MSAPRQLFPLVLVAYLGLVLALRTFGAAGGSIDDSEQLLYSQSWALAYGAFNPPGPTWLTRALQILLGPSLLSVTLPKFLWLGVTVLAFYACARRLLREPAHARMATLWLAGIYYISWECVQNYSHSVQVLAVSMLCVWQVLRMRRARSLGAYAVFGALCALGLLSKFNFAVLMAALLMASARVPAYRALLLDRRLALSVAVCLILLAPVLWAQWALLSTQMVATQHKFAIAPAWSAGLALSGALSAAKGLASWLSPLLVFVVLGMPRAVVGAAPQTPAPTPDGGDLVEDERWLRYVGGGILLVVTLLVLGSRAAEARTHYFQIAVPLVLWLAVRAELAQASLPRWRLVTGLSLTLAVVSPALLGLELAGVANITGRSRLTVPYAALASALQANGFQQGVVVSHDWPHALSGNLRPWLAGGQFFSLAHPDYRPPLPAAEGQCLLLWQTGERPAALNLAPPDFKPLLAGIAQDPPGVRYGQLALKTRGRAGTTVGIGWALWPTRSHCLALMNPQAPVP